MKWTPAILLSDSLHAIRLLAKCRSILRWSGGDLWHDFSGLIRLFERLTGLGLAWTRTQSPLLLSSIFLWSKMIASYDWSLHQQVYGAKFKGFQALSLPLPIPSPPACALKHFLIWESEPELGKSKALLFPRSQGELNVRGDGLRFYRCWAI